MIQEHMLNIQKNTNGQGDNFTTGFLPYHSYFKDHYKMIATELSKKQGYDADRKAIQRRSKFRNIYGLQQGFSLFNKQKESF